MKPLPANLLVQDLPSGWSWSTIADVTALVSRGRAPEYVASDGVPVVNQRCVRWSGIEVEHLKFTSQAQAERVAPHLFLRDGDVLWNSTGTGTIGRAVVYHALAGHERVLVDTHVTIVRADAYDPKLLKYWIESPAIQKLLVDMQEGSTNQVELNRDEIVATELPVPPLTEQRRLVERIEELFSELDAGVESLRRAKRLLERYRQSVLQSAVTGELTREWRARQGGGGETGRDLLARILDERRRKWEAAELAKLRKKGKEPKDDRWKAAYREPAPPDTAGLPELPEGWVWARWAQLGYCQNGRPFPSADYSREGIKLLRPGNLHPSGRTRWTDSNSRYLPKIYA